MSGMTTTMALAKMRQRELAQRAMADMCKVEYMRAQTAATKAFYLAQAAKEAASVAEQRANELDYAVSQRRQDPLERALSAQLADDALQSSSAARKAIAKAEFLDNAYSLEK